MTNNAGIGMLFLRFRTNRIDSIYSMIRFESIRIPKKNFNVILIFISFKFQYDKKFKLILYYYYSDDQTDE